MFVGSKTVRPCTKLQGETLTYAFSIYVHSSWIVVSLCFCQMVNYAVMCWALPTTLCTVHNTCTVQLRIYKHNTQTHCIQQWFKYHLISQMSWQSVRNVGTVLCDDHHCPPPTFSLERWISEGALATKFHTHPCTESPLHAEDPKEKRRNTWITSKIQSEKAVCGSVAAF